MDAYDIRTLFDAVGKIVDATAAAEESSHAFAAEAQELTQILDGTLTDIRDSLHRVADALERIADAPALNPPF